MVLCTGINSIYFEKAAQFFKTSTAFQTIKHSGAKLDQITIKSAKLFQVKHTFEKIVMRLFPGFAKTKYPTHGV